MIQKKGLLYMMNSKGYSLMELMMVLSIIAIVSQIGFSAWLDNKRRAYDATAVADTRNLIEAIVNDMVGAEDVLYSHDPEDGPRIGSWTKGDDTNWDVDNKGEKRKPSLYLSPGVKAFIRGATDVVDSNGITNTTVTAFLWHSGGTPWSGVTNLDNLREFSAVINEQKEEITFVGFKLN